MIDHDPCYKIPRVKTPRIAKPAPTPVEVRALIAKAEAMSKEAPEYGYIREWIIVANATGLRPVGAGASPLLSVTYAELNDGASLSVDGG